ncbi:FAD-binding protein [Sphingobium baderi]|uniref:FAD-binding protein n=1 Tax=Sphingobium baderi TaxID=1332080 RepID=UPI002B40D1EF|nr:FAD-binding protein [Sphingobium baderi]WRD75336.1 FAD-binding protein [Sphingobium baderi]
MATEQFDFIVIGSGAGSVPAALAAKAAGKSAVILEKQDAFGGSTSYSGGVAWLPLNPYLGDRDTSEKAMTYFDAIVGEVGPASSIERRKAFIGNAPIMVHFLEERGMRFKHAHWPDYYSDEPGGLAEGRSLVVPTVDIKKLGDLADRLARFPLWPPLPIGVEEFSSLSVAKTTWRGRWTALKVAARILWQTISGKKLRKSGNALQARLFEILLREKIPLRLSTGVVALVTDDGRVTGVEVIEDGMRKTILARHGVLINAGGFSHNQVMREQYQPKPLEPGWSTSNPGDTGEMIGMATALGAETDLMNEAWWVPGSADMQGNFRAFHVPGDTGKPHCIVVDPLGNRFGNEAGAYMEFGQRMFAAKAVPAWAVFDSRHRQRYPWGGVPPGRTPADWLESGYMIKADTIDEIARACGIDRVGLAATIQRFNGFAAKGVDEDFRRGYSAHNRHNGDPAHHPNPCLGTIEKGPFFAVRIVPVDVGTAGGLMTDTFARVLRHDGTTIEGLYATGNSTASVMGRHYLGAGASIGASMVFAFIGARHACGSNMPPAD